MIYSIEDMNKRILRTLYPVFMVLTGIIFALLSALVSGASVSAVSNPDLRFNSNVAAAAFYQAATPTPAAGAVVSRAGSTDNIMIMGVVIVIIVLVPILLRRSMWTK